MISCLLLHYPPGFFSATAQSPTGIVIHFYFLKSVRLSPVGIRKKKHLRINGKHSVVRFPSWENVFPANSTRETASKGNRPQRFLSILSILDQLDRRIFELLAVNREELESYYNK